MRPSTNSSRASSRSVDVGVEAVALVGELLEQHVVVVAHPDADRDELDPGCGVVGDPAEDAVRVGQADIGDAVGREDDPVDPVAVSMRVSRASP